MDPIAAQISLAEVSAILDIGQAETANAPSASPAQDALAIGQIINARVVGFSGGNTVVALEQGLYALKLPLATTLGQTLDLQVFQTSPGLTFRLVTNPDLPPSDAAEVTLGAAAAGPSDPELPVSPSTAEALQSPSVAPGVPYDVSSQGSLARTIAAQLQTQFEAQGLEPVDSPSSGQAPEAASSAPAAGATDPSVTDPSVTDPSFSPATPASMAATRESPAITQGPSLETSSNVLATPRDPTESASTPALPSVPSAQNGASGTLLGASATTTAPTTRPNALASTLSPATWQGQVWPGQMADVQIEPDRKRTAFEAPALNAWRATLKLTLPNLGTINAVVLWNTAGLRINVDASEATSADQMRSSSADLLETLRSLDMRVQSLGVRHA
jgi:hypothetical protein